MTTVLTPPSQPDPIFAPAAPPATAAAPGQSGQRAVGRTSQVALRLVAYVALAAPFVVGTVRGLRSGWVPFGDSAAIAFRASAAVARHPTLVGQMTTLRGIYDPGPLEYWLLFVPVHFDPIHGVYWGSALLCLGAAAIAVEAAWAVGGRVAGLIAAALILGNIAWWWNLAVRPWWNPYFGEMWFVAAVACAWAVLAGHRRWWPVLVLAASVAAQAHLMFAVASLTLVLVAALGGWAATRRARSAAGGAGAALVAGHEPADELAGKAGYEPAGKAGYEPADKPGYQWLSVGLGVGLACWLAPVFEAVRHSPGNLERLVSSEGRGVRTGLGFGLKTLVAATVSHPLWWSPEGADWKWLLHGIEARSIWLAALPVLVVVGVGVVGWWRRCGPLLALAGVTLVTFGAIVATFSNFPLEAPAFQTIGYIYSSIYPAGALMFACIGGAAGVLARDFLLKPSGRSAPIGARPLLAAAALTAVAPVALSGLAIAQGDAGWATFGRGLTAPSREIRAITADIRRRVPRQAVLLTVLPNGIRGYDDTLGVGWLLHAAGYNVGLTSPIVAQALGPGYTTPGHALVITVTVAMSGRFTVVTGSPT